MKKLFFVFGFLLFMACDDGDIEFQNSPYETLELKSCDLVTLTNFYLFKRENDKALILNLGIASEILFKKELTGNTPRQLTIQNNVKLIERIYSRSIIDGDICTTLPPTNLQVLREWQSTSGAIEVRTTALKTEPNANGQTRVQKFRHSTIVRNLTISRDGQLQTFDVYEVGFYDQNVTNSLPTLNGGNTLRKCPDSDRYIFTIGQFVFELNANSTLFENTDTPVNSPRVRIIDGETKFTYRFYEQTVNLLQVCELSTAIATEEWKAENGVSGVSGIVEVTTTSAEDPDQPTITIYTHQIKLKKVKMKRSRPDDGLDFLLGDVIDLGVYRFNQ